jgi:hypothetical protein
MSALVRSFRRLRSTQAVVVTLTLVACATAQDPNVDDNGTGTGDMPATGGGGNGGSAATGGKGGSLPIAGTTTFPMAGTNSGTAGKASGGAGTGGAPATAGTGSTPTAGTGSSSTCPTPYAGALATDSAIFTSGYGQSTTGSWKGYGFTFKYGTATITPGNGTGCFEAKKFCASGSVPASDSAGAGLGWNLNQAQGTSTTTAVAVTTPVKISVAGLPAGSRVQLSASATVQYCYTLTAAMTSATIPLASFKTECWGTEGVAYDGTTPIEAIQVVIPGAAAAAKTFDFCVLDVEPG